MSELVVQTAFTAKGDGVTSALKTQAKAADTLGGRLKAAFASASKQSGIFKSVLSANLMSGAITKGLSKIQQMASSTLDSYIDFDTAITMAASKFPEKIKRGTKEFDDLAAAARLVGKETTFSASQAAEGFNALAGAGFDMGQSIAAIKPLVAFATAANSDLASSTTVVADALGAFNLKSADAAILTANMTRLTDAFVFVTSTQKTSVEELSEAVKMGGPAFTGAGQSMEHFIAMTGLLASTGIKGGQAGTMLRSAMLKLAAPTAAASAALKKVGVATVDKKGNLLEFGEVMANLAWQMKDMGTGQKTKILQTIFGTESVSGVISLMNMGGQKLYDYEKQLESAAGKSDEMTKEIKQTLGNRLADLGSTVEEFGFKLITAFEKDGKDAIGQAIDAINKFDVKPIVEGAKQLLSGFKSFVVFVKDNYKVIAAVATAFVAVKVAIAAVNFVKAAAGIASIARDALKATTQVNALGKALPGVNAVTGASGGGMMTPQLPGKAGTTTGPGGGVGAAGVAGAAISAVIVGWTVGAAISTKLEEVGGETLKRQTSAENMLNKYKDTFRFQKEITEEQARIMVASMAIMQKGAKTDSTGLLSPFTRFAAWYSGAEDPMYVYLERQKQINELYARLQTEMGWTAEQLHALAQAAIEGRNVANVEITVQGDGAGKVETKSSSTGPAPPKVTVDQSKAGKV